MYLYYISLELRYLLFLHHFQLFLILQLNWFLFLSFKERKTAPAGVAENQKASNKPEIAKSKGKRLVFETTLCSFGILASLLNANPKLMLY